MLPLPCILDTNEEHPFNDIQWDVSGSQWVPSSYEITFIYFQTFVSTRKFHIESLIFFVKLIDFLFFSGDFRQCLVIDNVTIFLDDSNLWLDDSNDLETCQRPWFGHELSEFLPYWRLKGPKIENKRSKTSFCWHFFVLSTLVSIFTK